MTRIQTYRISREMVLADGTLLNVTVGEERQVPPRRGGKAAWKQLVDDVDGRLNKIVGELRAQAPQSRIEPEATEMPTTKIVAKPEVTE